MLIRYSVAVKEFAAMREENGAPDLGRITQGHTTEYHHFNDEHATQVPKRVYVAPIKSRAMSSARAE